MSMPGSAPTTSPPSPPDADALPAGAPLPSSSPRTADTVPAGDAAPAGARLRGFAWRGDRLEILDDVEAVHAAHADPAAVVWVDVEAPDLGVLEAMSSSLGIHELVIEDIVERNQRAKVERTEDVLHIVAFRIVDAGDFELGLIEIDLVLGRRFLLTTHEAGWDPFAIHLVRRDPAGVLAAGADNVLWVLTDALVDDYFPVFDAVGDGIEQLQDDVIAGPSREVLARLFRIRRALLLIRHAVSPQREVFNQLTNRTETLIAPERLIYFRDVYDHLIRLTDELDSYRELVTTTLDAYLSVVNNNLSDVMKRLTAVTVIIAGVGAVGGLFGMSEAGSAVSLTEASGFWLITVGVLVLAAVGLVYFRRIGWL